MACVVPSALSCPCCYFPSVTRSSELLRKGTKNHSRDFFLRLMLQQERGRQYRRGSPSNWVAEPKQPSCTAQKGVFEPNTTCWSVTTLTLSINHSHWGLCFGPTTSLTLGTGYRSRSARLPGKVTALRPSWHGCRVIQSPAKRWQKMWWFEWECPLGSYVGVVGGIFSFEVPSFQMTVARVG